jgi:hypothetical protein
MAKLTEFVTPTGARGDLTRPASLLPMVLGGVVFLAVIGAAAKLFGMVRGVAPAAVRPWLGNGGPFIRENDNAKPAAPTAPALRIYS